MPRLKNSRLVDTKHNKFDFTKILSTNSENAIFNTLNPTYPLNPNWSLKDQNVLLVIFELSNLVTAFPV